MSMSDLYQQNLITLQLAHQSATLNQQAGPGGFLGLLADIDVPLTRGLMKFFWRHRRLDDSVMTTEQIDAELDSYRTQLEQQNKPPLILTAVPLLATYQFLQELTQSEQMVRTGPGRRGESLLTQLERSPGPDHFFTLLIGRTEDPDEAVTLLVRTPTD